MAVEICCVLVLSQSSREREARAEGAAAAAGLLPAWQGVKAQAQSAVASALKCALSLL